jgi:hypothetical protein
MAGYNGRGSVVAATAEAIARILRSYSLVAFIVEVAAVNAMEVSIYSISDHDDDWFVVQRKEWKDATAKGEGRRAKAKWKGWGLVQKGWLPVFAFLSPSSLPLTVVLRLAAFVVWLINWLLIVYMV